MGKTFAIIELSKYYIKIIGSSDNFASSFFWLQRLNLLVEYFIIYYYYKLHLETFCNINAENETFSSNDTLECVYKSSDL